MKKIIFLSFILSGNLFADYRVEKVTCGSFTPPIDNSCLILATNKRGTNLFITDQDKFNKVKNNIKTNDFLNLNHKDLERVTSVETRIAAKKIVKDESFNIKEVFKLKNYNQKNVVFNQLKNSYSFECSSTYFKDNLDFLEGEMYLQAKLNEFDKSSFELSKFNLAYVIYEKGNYSYKWSEGTFKDGNFFNRYNYNPYKYKGFIKFENVFKKEVSGIIDILINPKNLSQKTFEAKAIMSQIEDHFGTTVSLSCSTF